MMKELEIIRYLLEEMKEAQEYKEFYEERFEIAKLESKARNVFLGWEIEEEFGIEKKPNNALIAQNAKKIRKLLLKLY